MKNSNTEPVGDNLVTRGVKLNSYSDRLLTPPKAHSTNTQQAEE